MIKTMDMSRNFGIGYGHLLDNPVLFLLFSNQAKAEFSMLLKHFGKLDRYMVIQVYSDAASRISDAKIIGIERTSPDFDALYRQQLSAAIRQTKMHKYLRSKDITVCAILESNDDYSRESIICEQIYNDLKSAYHNHVYFDFYVMVRGEFIPGVSLELSTHMNKLKEVEEKGWTRYIFLLFDITNEERLIAQYLERFQAVLDSIVLTNCRSSTGMSSTLINELLLEESAALESKFLSLGRIKMSFSETMVKSVIRYEMLECVQRMSSQSQIKLQPLNLDGLRYDIMASVKRIYPGIMQIGSYQCAERCPAAYYTNHEIISHYFKSNADYYMQFYHEKFEKEFRQYMTFYCQHEIKTWLMDALFQSSVSIFHRDFSEIISQRAINEIRIHCENVRQTYNDNEEKFAQWKNAKREAKRWVRWPLKRFQYEHYKVLEEWIMFRGKALAGIIFERCSEDIMYYIRKWAYRMEECRKLFSLCRLNARERLEKLLGDCCDAERHLIQVYQQKITRELKSMDADIQYIRSVFNSFQEESVDVEYMDRSIGRCVDWLYTQRLKNIKLYCEPDSSVFDEVLTNLKDHVCLFSRTQIPNIVPYIFLMGCPEDPFLSYVCQQNDAQYIVYETEYAQYPVAFYYQHIR